MSEPLMQQVLNDPDARVRANAIEAIDHVQNPQYLPTLSRMARSRFNRERANAIKALHSMKIGAASHELVAMLRDVRPEHRISAMWALKEVGLWQMLREIGRLAKSDGDMRVRRYAVGVIRSIATGIEKKKESA
jgi:hypothetical protein